MTRKQRYEWERDNWTRLAMAGPGMSNHMFPQVRAVYRMVIQRGPYGNVPHTHPDGSIFYEFVSKREY
jgi:hypothetical protein